jgi:hypothetical protein
MVLVAGSPSVKKRQKEQARKERQTDKAAKREQRKVERGQRPDSEADEDPDLAGITAGPHNLPEPQ